MTSAREPLLPECTYTKDGLHLLKPGFMTSGLHCEACGLIVASLHDYPRVINQPRPRKVDPTRPAPGETLTPTLRPAAKTKKKPTKRAAAKKVEWTGPRTPKMPGVSCRYCGTADNLTREHLTPIVRGGENVAANRDVSCVRCNSLKSDATDDEFWAWLRDGTMPDRRLAPSAYGAFERFGFLHAAIATAQKRG